MDYDKKPCYASVPLTTFHGQCISSLTIKSACLYASYHSDTGPQEPLMWGSSPLVEKGLIPLLTGTLKNTTTS